MVFFENLKILFCIHFQHIKYTTIRMNCNIFRVLGVIAGKGMKKHHFHKKTVFLNEFGGISHYFSKIGIISVKI